MTPSGGLSHERHNPLEARNLDALGSDRSRRGSREFRCSLDMGSSGVTPCEILPREVVRYAKKGRYRSAKATVARTLYASGFGVSEIVEAMAWTRKNVMQVLRRVP